MAVIMLLAICNRVVYDTPFSFAFMVILTSVFFGFVMNLDFGRYQLSLLTSAINSFRAEKLGGNHPEATYQLWWFINRLKISFGYYYLSRLLLVFTSRLKFVYSECAFRNHKRMCIYSYWLCHKDSGWSLIKSWLWWSSALRWCYLDVVQWEPPLKEKSGSKNPDERNNLAGTFK